MPVHEGPNLFNLVEFDGRTSFFEGSAPLSQGFGYAVVVGFGLAFGVITTLLVWSDITYGGNRITSEEFTTAGRTIKTGLIAVDVVSHWTWAATLLQSSNVAFDYGISGPFWYAAGASIQILLFGILAVEVKRRAPTAHTILEIINARWGMAAHLTFFFFCILTNVVVTAMLFLGGASVLSALTDMNIYAAAFLMPLGVIIYTVAGLKATFLSSYLHTVIIYLALCIFSLNVYATGDKLGSPRKVWENLVVLSQHFPVEGNRAGSYLTMYSKGGLIFGIINIVGNFGAVFVDQAYWQTAIAAKPSSAHKGYFLGGIMWFCIPFTLATTMGLGALALDLPISAEESEAGLVPPALAVYIMGHGGALLVVIMVFMAVTSTGSAELIAVSSLVTYDLYRTYFRNDATGKDILVVSRSVVLIFGCIMGILASALLAMQISLGYVYLVMGVLIGSAVMPIACCLCWKRCSAKAATTGAMAGLVIGVACWLGTAYARGGAITIATTGGDLPMLAGNLGSICSSGILVVVISLIWPDDYDWESMRMIKMLDSDVTGFSEEGPDSLEALMKARRFIWAAAIGTSVVLAILWPLFTCIPGVLDATYFEVWVIVSMVWGGIATVTCVILPIWESWRELRYILANMILCSTSSQDEIHDKWEQTKPLPLVPGGNPLVAQEEIAKKQQHDKSGGPGSPGSGSNSTTPKMPSPHTSATNGQAYTLAARLTLQHLSSPSSSLTTGITRASLRGKTSSPSITNGVTNAGNTSSAVPHSSGTAPFPSNPYSLTGISEAGRKLSQQPSGGSRRDASDAWASSAGYNLGDAASFTTSHSGDTALTYPPLPAGGFERAYSSKQLPPRPPQGSVGPPGPPGYGLKPQGSLRSSGGSGGSGAHPFGYPSFPQPPRSLFAHPSGGEEVIAAPEPHRILSTRSLPGHTISGHAPISGHAQMPEGIPVMSRHMSMTPGHGHTGAYLPSPGPKAWVPIGTHMVPSAPPLVWAEASQAGPDEAYAVPASSYGPLRGDAMGTQGTEGLATSGSGFGHQQFFDPAQERERLGYGVDYSVVTEDREGTGFRPGFSDARQDHDHVHPGYGGVAGVGYAEARDPRLDAVHNATGFGRTPSRPLDSASSYPEGLVARSPFENRRSE